MSFEEKIYMVEFAILWNEIEFEDFYFDTWVKMTQNLGMYPTVSEVVGAVSDFWAAVPDEPDSNRHPAQLVLDYIDCYGESFT